MDFDHVNQKIEDPAGGPIELSGVQVPDNSTGNVSRWVMDTVYAPTTGHWVKIASYTGGIHETFLIIGRGEDGKQSRLVIDIAADSGLTSGAKLEVLTSTGDAPISHTGFMFVGSGVAGETNVLWMQIPASSSSYSVYSIGQNLLTNTSYAYHNNEAAQASTPTGAVTVTSDRAGSGTYAPVLSGATTAGAGTYTTQTGSYTRRNGRIVGTGRLTWTAHTGTGNMQVSLPGTVASSTEHTAPFALWTADVSIGSGKVPFFVAIPGTSYADIYAVDPVTGTGPAVMDTAGDMIFFFDYEEA